MKKTMQIYTNTVFLVVRTFFLFGCVAGVLFSLAAGVDLAFDLRWGFNWQTILGGGVFALGSYGGSLFAKKISETYNRIRG